MSWASCCLQPGATLVDGNSGSWHLGATWQRVPFGAVWSIGGDKILAGADRLGRALMKVRAELRAERAG